LTTRGVVLGGFERLASEWWASQGGPSTDFDADYRVDALIDSHSDSMPALIKSLANTAPDGALSYIGVSVLEDMAMAAERDHRPDVVVETLFAAKLEDNVTFEILSGPYPEYLERWRVRECFAGIFTQAQMDVLMDWQGRFNRWVVIDGGSVRDLDLSAWFNRQPPSDT
jgi:hypothetical protein